MGFPCSCTDLTIGDISGSVNKGAFDIRILAYLYWKSDQPQFFDVIRVCRES